MSMPGTPIVYYGDEIGMGDNVYLGDRNGVRTPMQWTGEKNAGFSQGDSAALYAPLIADYPYSYHAVNVEAQERFPSSLLHWMRDLIRARKQYRAFGRGSWEAVPAVNKRVLVFIRQHEGQTILCVNNLSKHTQYTEVDLSRFAGCSPIELFSEGPFPPITEQPYLFTLPPHTFLWFRLLRSDKAQEMQIP
jgi:maltose alpha-D-glucosyltransferase/alpha-amylase